MTYKQYVENLQKFLEQNPKCAEYTVVYAKDDEGNGYDTVNYDTPQLGEWDHEEREIAFEECCLNEDEEFTPNAVCVN